MLAIPWIERWGLYLTVTLVFGLLSGLSQTGYYGYIPRFGIDRVGTTSTGTAASGVIIGALRAFSLGTISDEKTQTLVFFALSFGMVLLAMVLLAVLGRRVKRDPLKEMTES